MSKNDLKTSCRELVKILDKKLKDKKVADNYDKVTKRNRPRLSDKLLKEIEDSYEKYRAKYDKLQAEINRGRIKAVNKDAAVISFYSNYVALKRIGEVL